MHDRRSTIPVFWTELLLFLALLSCTPPTKTTQDSMLSGTVINGRDGTPVSGVLVTYGSLTSTTGADGTYSLNLGSVGIRNETFSVVAPNGYRSRVVDPLTIDTSLSYTQNLLENGPASGTKVTLSGRIYELQTNASSPTELTTGWTVGIATRNRYGLGTGVSGKPYSSGYSVLIPIGTSDNLVAITATPPPASALHAFTVLLTSRDLSSSASIDVTEVPAGEKTMVLTGSDLGSGVVATVHTGQMALLTPYGPFQVLDFDFLSNSSNTSPTLGYSNPLNYPAVFTQSASVIQDSVEEDYSAQSAEVTVGSPGSVALPALVLAEVPAAAPDQATVAYSPATGVLAVAAVAGANGYRFDLLDGSSPLPVASITSTGPSVTLPSAFQAALKDMALSVSVTAVTSSHPDLDLAFALNNPASPFHEGETSTTAGPLSF